MVMLVLLCVTVTVLPVSIAFYDELNPGWLTVNIITDTLFILDIVVNFRTGILVQTQYPRTVMGGVREPLGGPLYDGLPLPLQVVLEPKQIAKAYLRGWFIIDFVSSIPFDYLTLFARTGSEDNEASLSPSLIKASRALRIVRLTKLLSLLRLLRISRMLRYLQRWEEVRGHNQYHAHLGVGAGTLTDECLPLLHPTTAGVSLTDTLLQRCWWHPPHWEADYLHAPAGPLERLHPVPCPSPAGCA